MADISTCQKGDYAELCLRANARRYWPEMGFRDPAAQVMLERLGLGGAKSKKHGCIERRALQRSHWFDRRCEHFFARHPHALCIEIGAGFSTRFHRLSATADWPRFRWLEVDVPDVIRQKKELLPPIDNYQLMAGELASADWLEFWRGEPLIILVERRLMYSPSTDVETLFRNIAARARDLTILKQVSVPIDIVFDYVSPAKLYWQRCLGLFHKTSFTNFRWGLETAHNLSELDLGYALVDEISLCDVSNPLKRWVNRSYQWVTRGKHLEACAAVTWTYS